MVALPSRMEPLVMSLSVAFTEPTFRRVVVLMLGAILTRGRRTVTGMWLSVRAWAPGHISSYHRIFSRAPWSMWPLAKVLASAILRFVPLEEPVVAPMDDTTAQHRGKNVYGKGCHHDAVRSSHCHIVWRWGHRWVVLALSVKLPFSSKRWALPVLAALYRPEALDRSEHRRHKTPPQLARQLMAVLIHWFPRRTFVFPGDGGYASHDLAKFCSHHGRHGTLVSRFYGDANLRDPPTPHKGPGRPAVKGNKLPTPQQVVACARRTHTTVSWYGGRSRRVELVSGTGHWYKSGQGLVAVRWVFVHDRTGTHRDEYLYSTDLQLSPAQIVSYFTARWPIETTFEEIRAHLGFETPRQRTRNCVLRMAPCLMGLFSLISLFYAQHTRHHPPRLESLPWYIKHQPTFSDAMAAVRQMIWAELLSAKPSESDAIQKLPPRIKKMLLYYLARAA